MNLRKQIYTPVITSRDAEYRGFSQLASKTLDTLLPVIEITRSRRSKSNPQGDIQKNVDRMVGVLVSRPFVVDLCGLDSQANAQIEGLLNPDEGFANWTSFLRQSVPSTAIPVLHLEDPFDADNFRLQVESLKEKFGCFALRVPTSYGDLGEAVKTLSGLLDSRQTYVAFIDCGYVKETTKNGAILRIEQMLPDLLPRRPELCAPLASSFPMSVLDDGYGQDDQGEFRLSEVDVSERIKVVGQGLGLNVLHGDYSTIHPNDFMGTVTNWVPRIDVPLDRTLFYHRVRRPMGGYDECARRVVADPRYAQLPSWGIQQIDQAGSGQPPGKSPSFWISVRLNIHIERQVNRLK